MNVFDELKQKVTIQEVASRLGYKVNTRAGTHGRYLEMQLYAGNDKLDTIVIRKPSSGGHETYFHRNGMGGTVIDFVKENVHALGYSSGKLWKDVFNAFASFTNLPPDAIPQDEVIRAWQAIQPKKQFDPSRFEISPITDNIDAARMIFTTRAISDETIQTFAPWIDLVRDTQSSFAHPCLGFPYREPGRDEVVGYELRGYGTFKGKAAGTNSTTAAWIVDMRDKEKPLDVRRVYFAESAYDIMSLWQRNHVTIDKETSVFVSVGGQLSPRQVSGIMRQYPKANAVDCFDNDIAGRIYGIRTAAIVSGIHLDVIKCDDCVRFNANGKQFTLPLDNVSTQALFKQVPLITHYEQCLPPKGFKDWNDVVRGITTDNSVTPSKYMRDEKLRQRRAGMKL